MKKQARLSAVISGSLRAYCDKKNMVNFFVSTLLNMLKLKKFSTECFAPYNTQSFIFSCKFVLPLQ